MFSALIVDDDPIFGEFLAALIQRHGIVPELVRSGEAALKALAVRAFNLVITDLVMPDMDGIELVRAIREENKDLPIIVITGSARRFRDIMGRALLCFGANFVFPKPINHALIGEAALNLCRGTVIRQFSAMSNETL